MITPEEIRRLVQAGESLEVEFKREVNDDELIEAVVCLANSRGGWLLIGVDKDGTIVGARPRHGSRTDPQRIEALVANRTRSSFTPLAVKAEVVTVGGREVIAIRVPAVPLVGTSDGRYRRRAIGSDGQPQCIPMAPHEVASRLGSLRQVDLTAQVVPEATWDDLSPLEFDRARQIIEEHRGDEALLKLSNEDMARVLGAIDENGAVTLAGLLLFGRDKALKRFVPTHEVAFQVIENGEVRVNEFMRWPLIRTSEEIYSRFRARYEERELMLGMFRVPVPDYDPHGFREAVHNALLHRDYALLGAVHIQWYPDRIEVTNPGGFPEGVRLDNILVAPPTPRNPLLADAFKRLGLVERTGRGIDLIFEGCLRYGRRAPDYTQSTETYVKVIIPGGPAHLDFTRLVIEESNKRQQPLSVQELLILHEAWQQRRIDTSTAAKLIQQNETAARAVLEQLVESGLLEARGEKRARVYHLSAAVYRALGQPEAYARTRGFEGLQMEEMIITHVRGHGRITRRDVVELCRVQPHQAYYLLQKLVRQGRLVRRGRGKATYYELPNRESA